MLNISMVNLLVIPSWTLFVVNTATRGPPKGYIDAIETRLHQAEAILGTVISSSDPRARSLIADLQQDTLASSVIARVDSSPFGTNARIAAGAQGFLSVDRIKAQRVQGSRKNQLAGSKIAVTPSDGLHHLLSLCMLSQTNRALI